RDLPHSKVKAYVLSQLSRYQMLASESEAIRIGREALAMSRELGLSEWEAAALNNIGVARIFDGDVGGLEDLERCIEIAPQGSPELGRGLSNLANSLFALGRLRQGAAVQRRAHSHETTQG